MDSSDRPIVTIVLDSNKPGRTGKIIRIARHCLLSPNPGNTMTMTGTQNRTFCFHGGRKSSPCGGSIGRRRVTTRYGTGRAGFLVGEQRGVASLGAFLEACSRPPGTSPPRVLFRPSSLSLTSGTDETYGTDETSEPEASIKQLARLIRPIRPNCLNALRTTKVRAAVPAADSRPRSRPCVGGFRSWRFPNAAPA